MRVSTRSQRTHDEVRLDLSREELDSRFLRPYNEGRPIVVGGRTIPTSDLERLRINYTDEPSSQLRPIVEAEQGASSVVAFIPVEWDIADKGREVTDELVVGPPGSALRLTTTSVERESRQRRPRVYSRDKARVGLENLRTQLNAIRGTFARGQEDLFNRQQAYRFWWGDARSTLLSLFDDPSVADRVLPSPAAFVPESASVDQQFTDVNSQMDRSTDRVGALLNEVESFPEVGDEVPLDASLSRVDASSLEAIRDAADVYKESGNVTAASPDTSYDVFICHAGEDKEAVVRPLAQALRERKLRVWYDEFELRIGDSLRRRIDDGLSSCRFGVVVLSPSFFDKEWPQRELDGLVSRETAETSQIVLPIWHNISRADVVRRSPTLADKFARNTSEVSVEDIAAEIAYVARR